jgi:hypothetical protein
LTFDKPTLFAANPGGGKDAMAAKGSVPFAMAVYFPRGAQRFSDILSKFETDLAGARRPGPTLN